MAKFEVLVGERVLFRARSATALKYLIEKDGQKWRQHFGGERVENRRTGEHLDFGTQRLIDHIGVLPLEDGADLSVQISGNPSFALLPPFESVEGTVIRQSWETGVFSQTFGILLYWYVENGWKPHDVLDRTNEYGREIRAGMSMIVAARAARTALMAKQPEIRPLELAERTSAAVERVEVAATEAKNDIHAANKATKDLAESFVRRERLRAKFRRRYEHKIASYWRKKFESTHEAYVLKLRYEAPVTLWTNRADEHSKAFRLARNWFVGVAAVFVIGALMIAFFGGDAIAASYQTTSCGDGVAACFSPKGPLVTGTLLLAASMIIWVLRMLYRTLLSERLLAQDAKERRSFAETYYALVNDKKATNEHEAIVLGALFRPSRDGSPGDDSGGMDLSSAAVLAKVLSGSNK